MRWTDVRTNFRTESRDGAQKKADEVTAFDTYPGEMSFISVYRAERTCVFLHLLVFVEQHTGRMFKVSWLQNRWRIYHQMFVYVV